VEAEPFSSP